MQYLTGNKDVDVDILFKLDYPDIVKLCRVNKYANSLCNSETLWKKKALQDFPEDTNSDDPLLDYDIVSWKELYKRFYVERYYRDKAYKFIEKTVTEDVFERYSHCSI